MYWQSFVSDSRPTLSVRTNTKQFSRLVDTGAEVSIISEKHWPISWPLTDVLIVLTGIGTMQNIQKGTNILTCSDPEQQRATLQALSAEIPINLWGLDLLIQWGAYVTAPTISPQAKQSWQIRDIIQFKRHRLFSGGHCRTTKNST